MLILILKSSACLAVFMAFYKLFLEKESIHNFKRFYLLGAILVSIVIPFITFTQYTEVAPIENFIPLAAIESVQTETLPSEITTSWQNNIPVTLWTLYVIGVLLFSFRFVLNLRAIFHRIKTNPKHQYHEFTNVLLQDLIHPHTFFRYIFLNKTKYENNLIPSEVLLHEQTHAKQKHALDILCIEFLQILFWFNPLLYFIKKDIKLNHEFLADQSVLQKGVNSTQYKQTLLAFSSVNSYQDNRTHQLTNAINYSLIKKRFTVMKTQTSKRAIWLKSLVLLPLLAITLYSFSDTKVVEKTFEEISDINHTARSIDIEVFDNGTYEIDGIKATKKTFISVINQLHQDITPEIRNRIINVHVNNGKVVLDEEVWFIYNSVFDYGFHRIVTYNQEIIREKGNKPFAITNTDTQEQSNTIFKKSEQQKASKEQIAEYNKLAKRYNDMPKDNMVIKRSDLERLKYLYHLMSSDQRKNAQPFPNIPAPPAPRPVSPNSPPPPPLPDNATDAQKRKYKEAQKTYSETIKLNKVRMLQAEKGELIRVREIHSDKLKQEKLAYREAQVAARTLKAKAQKERVQVREIRSTEDRKKLMQEKRVYREAQVAARTLKAKAQKEQRVQVREIRSAEDRKKLMQEKRVYREAQVAARVQKAKAGKERRIVVREVLVPPPPLKKNATPEQKRRYEAAMKAYKLSKEHKAKDGKTRQIKDVPPPPPIPETVSVEEREQMIEVTEAYHNELERVNEVEVEEISELEEVEVENVVEVEEVAIEEVELEEINENQEVVETEKVSLLDYVIQLKKKGALFFLDEKQVSSKKGIELIRLKQYKSVETHPYTNKNPEVKIITK